MKEIELFKQYIGREPEDRLMVFDVGAFNLRSTKQLKRAFPNIIIHGFEADIRNYNRFLPDNRGEDIYYNHYAISDREEVVRFYPSLHMGEKEWRCSGSICEPVVDENDCHRERWTTLSFDTKGTDVQSIRLDHYCRSRDISTIDYLHIDVQGAELRVMRGLGDVNARIVFAETNILGDQYYKTGTTLDEFDDFMSQAGYGIRYRDASDTLYVKRSSLRPPSDRGSVS